ncbi:methylated-DNA/protein-cysteinemethyltransferase [Flexistipes sinusarabici DSM 4947]|uniref:Methylated-DNA/protein-cysteinemethyltransferase n=2 Tax=Flexistipes sinusarabici TaxID=2352 RepID=F8E7N4_FLESM|nr:MGMT family protein [Flexistipes sinusarabici]AEI13879.1 methylated-DNA/protein-cysteinemethyltransferase [Flexistipes sinusarabici DSM 4947]HCW92244.1 methylated-DNA--[protein]-cysteine S-methyltransferase [Flexistipes sinusarabici]
MDLYYNFRSIVNLKLSFNDYNNNLDSVSFTSSPANALLSNNISTKQQQKILYILDNYENNPEIDLSVLNFRRMSDFAYNIYSVLSKIPIGQTITYSTLAEKAGKPRAARAAGTLMKSNAFALIIPCHRVVGKNSIGGFSSGLRLKERLLKFEQFFI